MLEYNYIPRQHFLSKNSQKTSQNAENDKIYQLVMTNILMGMIQCFNAANLK